MNFTEFGRKTLSCGTFAYSYISCVGGYMIKITNLDTNYSRYTAGINVSKNYFPIIMTNLIENDITPDDMDMFLILEMTKYAELYPSIPKKSQRKYLYL